VEFPIYPYRKYRGEHRISLAPRDITSKPYNNPIRIALEYKEALEHGKHQNQTELAKELNISRARVNQYLRLLKLPDTIQDDIRSGRVKATERQLRRLLTAR